MPGLGLRLPPTLPEGSSLAFLSDDPEASLFLVAPPPHCT